jgi:hypothetical protein
LNDAFYETPEDVIEELKRLGLKYWKTFGRSKKSSYICKTNPLKHKQDGKSKQQTSTTKRSNR